MPGFYVYAPITGTVTSCWTGPVACPADPNGCGNRRQIAATGKYCGGAYTCGPCCHPSVSCNEPQDIMTGGGTPDIVFTADPIVASIWVGLASNACSSESGCSSLPYTRVMTVYMYSGLNGSGTFLGVVIFVHVNNAIASGYYNTSIEPGTGHAYKVIGSVPPDSCGRCYTGPHLHWERCGNSVVNSSISCGDTMLRSLSWVFRYSY